MPAWCERCFVYYTWAKHGEPMTREWTSNLVKRAQTIGAEAIVFGVQLGGHVAYRSDLSPSIPDMETDVLGQLCEECHARNLRVVPMLITTTGGCFVQVQEHPDWQFIGPDSKPLGTLCYSSPFGDFTESQTRELLKQYPLDGLYFDQLSAGCYCPYCLDNFRRQYGYEMPREDGGAGLYPGQANLPMGQPARDLRDFRLRMAIFFCARIRRVLNRTRPDAIYIQNWLFGPAAAACAEFVDGILPERHLSQSNDVNALGISNRLARAYADKAVWANVSHAYHHHATVHTVEHTHLLLMEGVAAGCCPTVVELNALDQNPNRRADLVGAMQQVSWSSRAHRGASPVRYAALLHSSHSDALFKSEHNGEFDGYYEILRAQHLPVEVLTERGVQQGDLQGFKVLIVPDAVCLADGTVTAIERFVRSGGGLVATYRSGEREAMGGLRPRSALADLTGVRPLKLVTYGVPRDYPSRDPVVNIPSIDLRADRTFFHYARAAAGHPAVGQLSDELLAFHGDYVEGLFDDDVRTAVWILEADQSRINMRPYNRRGLFPGEPLCPLVATREASGRVVYVAAELGPERSRHENYELDRLVRDLVIWAAGAAPPLAAEDLPPSVHVSLSQREDAAVVVAITNQTTSPIHLGSIRWIAPFKQLSLKIHAPGTTRAESASGQARLVEAADGWVTVELPRLGVADCVVLSKA